MFSGPIATALVGYGLCAVGLGLSVRTLRVAVVVVCCAAGLLRLSCSLDPCLHPWDERYHAVVAKNCATDPLEPKLYSDPDLPHSDFNWTQTGIWLHKPPLATWLIAGSLRLFGNETWAVRLPSTLFGCLAAFLCFQLGRLIVSPRAGLVTSFLWAINGHLIELASGRTATDHVDALLVVLVLAGAVCAVMMARTGSLGWALGCGSIAGLAFLTKAWPSLIIVLVAAVLLFSVSRAGVPKKFGLLLCATVMLAVVAAPWQILVHTRFDDLISIESRAQWAHFTQDVEDHGRPWYYYLTQFPMIHGEAAPLALIVAAFLIRRHRMEFGPMLLVWVAVPFLLFSWASSKMPAYTAIAAPAIFLLIAMVVDHWWSNFGCVTGRRWWAILGIALLLGLPLRFSMDRVKPFEQANATYTITEELRLLGPKDVLVGFPDPIAVMFHTEVGAAYSELDEAREADVRSRGYRLFRFENGQVIPK